MLIDQTASAFPGGQFPVPRVESVLEHEVDRLTDALAARFEELTLINELSRNLTLLGSPAAVVGLLLEELRPCIDAETLLISVLADPVSDSKEIVAVGGKQIDVETTQLLAVAVEAQTRKQFDDVRVSISNSLEHDGKSVHVVVVPIQHESMVLGRMIAIRPATANEFGTVEADLMKSTSLMLSVHLINQRQYLELQQMFEGMIQSLVSALEAKDTYTHGHSNRVAELSVEIAARLGYQSDQLAKIRMGGILHDIGKIGVDESVLGKAGRLTDEEFDQIKRHPMIGFDILKGIHKFAPILPIVRSHHESWDGSGYPDGLAGDDIPRDAQIVAVADAFDAMTSDRPYRTGMSLEKVTGILQGGRGTQWAADAIDALLSAPELMKQYAKH